MFDWVMKFFQESMAVSCEGDYIVFAAVCLEKQKSVSLQSTEMKEWV